MFVRATYYRDKKTVHYFDENGEETLYIGGSFAWRTNNPGNMAKPGKRVVGTSIGYAQRTSSPKSLFLIFPDRATGDAERIRLLKEVYGDNSIASMIEAYAPRNENDTDGYIATVSKATGVDKSTRLDALTDDQFKKLTAAMAKHEGWIPGKIVPLGKPKVVDIKDSLQQPLASQTVGLKGTDNTFRLKTDHFGALPPLYPKLFDDNMSLYLDSTEDLIGRLERNSEATSCTFLAPYFFLTSRAEVHEIKELVPPAVHIVKEGQTLGKIAEQHGVTLQALAEANQIKDYDKIFARQHLRIPPKARNTASHMEPTVTPARAKPAAPDAPRAAEPPTKAPPKSGPGAIPSAARIDAQRTDKKHPITVVSTPPLEVSGPQWCARFKGDNTIDALLPPFREKVKKFLQALKDGGVTVSVNAVYRPVERSYLMYWAFMICKGADVTSIPSWPGVNIDWTHRGPDGRPDIAKAKAAAKKMCQGYSIDPQSPSQKVGKPGKSNHNFRKAIDITPSKFDGKYVKDAFDNRIKIVDFTTLVKIGETFGVHYFKGEKMHWSYNGR
jgi:LysM repeat protein